MDQNNHLYIETVCVERKNEFDSTKTFYKVKGDPKVTIQWCRRNFGERGDGWDFVGSNQNLEVLIWSKKLKVIWELWQE